MHKYMPQIPTKATMGPPFSVLNQCPQPVMNAHDCVIDIEKKMHSLTPSRFPSRLIERPKRMRIPPTAWIEQPRCISVHSSLLNVQMTQPMNLLEKGSDWSTSLSLSAAECHVTADPLLSDQSTWMSVKCWLLTLDKLTQWQSLNVINIINPHNLWPPLPT